MLSRELFVISVQCSPHILISSGLPSPTFLLHVSEFSPCHHIVQDIQCRLCFCEWYLLEWCPLVLPLYPDLILIFLELLPSQCFLFSQANKLISSPYSPSVLPFSWGWARDEGILDLNLLCKTSAFFTLQLCLSTEPQNLSASPMLQPSVLEQQCIPDMGPKSYAKWGPSSTGATVTCRNTNRLIRGLGTRVQEWKPLHER